MSTLIEKHYQAAILEGGFSKFKDAPIEVTYKTEAKHTGFKYRVDFSIMRQVNEGTGWRRKLLRRQNPHYLLPLPMGGSNVVTIQVVVPKMSGGGVKKKFWQRGKNGQTKLQVTVPGTGGKTTWIRLPPGAKPGQIIQCDINLGASGSGGGGGGGGGGCLAVRRRAHVTLD